MHDGLLPIGAFSRAAALSVGTLRHYHDIGLLSPVLVDPQSGYRYYSAAQLLDAEVIRRLRDLDLPIQEVLTILAARDERVTSRVIQQHQERMAQRLAEARRIVDDLHDLVRRPLRLLAERVTERFLPDLDVVARTATVSVDDLAKFLGNAYPELAEEALHAGLTLAGPAGAIYPGEEWNPGEVKVTAFVPVTGDARPAGWTHLPGGPFAVGVHEGPYESIEDTYRAVGVWFTAADQPAGRLPAAGLEIRESYLVGPGDTEDPAGFRTEIAWPLDHPTPTP